MSQPFIAEVRIFGGNFAPRNWAFCDGQLLPIAQNTALFSLIGTTYGGDGRTTTALPDLRGRAPMHPGRGPGLTTRRLGQRGGSETATLSQNQMPAHNHAAQATSMGGNEDDPNPNTYLAAGATPATLLYGPSSSTLSGTIGLPNAGSGQPHTNVQPFQTLSFIIALQGLYPSRS